MPSVVHTSHLTKYYGRIRAVDDLTVEIPEKSIFGLLGPNGSGKTTTLGMLLDVINPTSGSYSWFDNYSNKENRQKIGSLLETPAFYPYLNATDNLKIVADIKATGYDQINELLKLVGLYERRYSSYHTFSLGMKQRLALASALLNDPSVMILDEPTNGLDPRGIAEIRQLIRNIANQGRTIILASHLLDEVQKVCTHFAVLDMGRLIYTGLVNEVSAGEQQVEINCDNPDKLRGLLEKYPGASQLEELNEHLVVTLKKEVTVAELSRYVFENGLAVTHLISLKKSLESQFLEILNDKK